MTFRSRLWLAAVVGVSLTPTLALRAAEPPAEPARLTAVPAPMLPVGPSKALVDPNLQLADNIADQLRQNGQLRHYDLDVACHNGFVWVAGAVADQSQREEVLRMVRGVPGVDRVIDQMTVPAPIERVQAQIPPPFLAAQPKPMLPPPVPDGAAARPAPTEPMPIFQAPPPSPYDLNPPRMPPYAWPTYAPYNNFSRVATPETYPYNAWPFIGPCYPFPKVPLGWRSVKLEWDDGHWWYSKVANKYDYWRLRFW